MIDLKAEEIIKRYNKLVGERVNWDSHWREIAEYIVPNKDNVYRFTRAPGEKKFTMLYDATTIHANELLASALHGMLTNPTTPFFFLSTGSQSFDAQDDIRKYLQECVRIMHNTLNQSNFQTEIHEVYLDLGSFGTGCLRIEEDDENIIRFMSHPIYEVYIDEDYQGQVSTVLRSFKKKIYDLEQEFGEDVFKNVTNSTSFNQDKMKEVEVLHYVGPNNDYNPNSREVSKRKFVSTYVLKGEKVLISERYFSTFPYAVPRWTKISGEKYGRSPGMKSLPDTKMINQMMKVTIRSAQKQVDPPLMAPDEGFAGKIRSAPGEINFYRAGTPDRIEPLNTGGRVDFAFQMMEDTRARIRQAYFIDQLQLREGPQMTATEVMQRTEEQLRLLGPILGRQHNELLKPLIDRLFEILLRRGLLPEPPESLLGANLEVQYASMIARAQKTAEMESINRLFQFVGPIMQVDPTVADNFDADGAFRYIANSLALPYEIMRDAQVRDEIRQQRQQAAQEAQQAERQMQEAEQVNKLAPALEQ